MSIRTLVTVLTMPAVVSVTPKVLNGHVVAAVALLKGTTVKTLSEPFE